MSEVVRRRVRVAGTVQGVGFRPHVYGLAADLELAGHVGNDARGVFIELEGPVARIEDFLRRLRAEPPPLAVVESVESEPTEPTGEQGFEIVESAAGGDRQVLISPDVATCAACRAEVADPDDRRHRYAFTNCTNCGPRYTIIRDVPYDRPATTMASFPMCDPCAAEYEDPTDRRFHAQPVCCPACGPRLQLLVDGRQVEAGEIVADTGDPHEGDRRGRGPDLVEATAALLAEGQVVAVKGLGGYHLAALASDQDAVKALRARKHREEKPFALMAADLEASRRLCEIDEDEAALLTSPARPIVLLDRRPEVAVADGVAPGNRSLGIMLPYTPLHHLLLEAVGEPIVLTSGNVSDEPIAYRDDDALKRLEPIADALLTHDRAIHIRVDDSVARVMADTPVVLRRSRGYAPRPVQLVDPLPRHILAVGAELKNTICAARDTYAFLSHHIGDLENWETLSSFREAIEHITRLFDVHPEVVAHDLHPEYLSTKDAMSMAGVELVGVQHHHAHIASCLADNRVTGPVIGVSFDGTGFGTDGTIWGGELLVCDLAGFERVGHLSTVPMPGGEAAIREPWRMAAAHLDAAFDGDLPDRLGVIDRNADRFEDVLAVARSGMNSPTTSSMGRLFDAVAAIVGVRDTVTYEGQAAIELEQRADPTVEAAFDVSLGGEVAAGEAGGADGVPAGAGDGPLRMEAGPLIRQVTEAVQAGEELPSVAARFHNWLVAAITAACERIRERRGLGTVALSGGVFQNALLVERLAPSLREAGFAVLTHRQVPPNDGGISLGQVAVVGARDRGT